MATVLQSGALSEILIRPSTELDRDALARLAELDSAPQPVGEHLVLEEGGQLRAAVSVDGGPALADPFHSTADLVAMLELRAARIGRPVQARAEQGWRQRSRRPQAAPATAVTSAS